jgi:hypothetical protein
MKIIAVNINKALASNPKPTVLDATKRAWKLKINRCKDYDYVIGVVNGVIIECFDKPKNGQHYDSIQPNRVEFDLTPCNIHDDNLIRNYCNNKNLRGITTKYID